MEACKVDDALGYLLDHFLNVLAAATAVKQQSPGLSQCMWQAG
jgi:hypothetical protein